MTVSQHIDIIKNMLSHGVSSDDFRISDRLLYDLLKSARARLIKNESNKSNYINGFNFYTIDCVPLSPEKLVDCGCITSDCNYLISEDELPKIIVNQNRLLIDYIMTPAGTNIDESSRLRETNKKYSLTKKDKRGFFIKNNRLVITGDTHLESVTVRALFENIDELENFKQCSDNTITKCFDPSTSEFPIDQHLGNMMRRMVYKEALEIAMKMPQDSTNNSLDDLASTRTGNTDNE